MTYSFTTQVNCSFEQAIEKTTSALAEKKFGVITTIDVQETFRKKLDKNIEKYTILGACNPTSAYKALQADIHIGLLLPCNVIVYGQNGKIFISAIKPSVAMGFLEIPELQEPMAQVEQSLQEVIESL